jgi:hypothetical protein
MLFDDGFELEKLNEAYTKCLLRESAGDELFSSNDLKEFEKLFGIKMGNTEFPNDLYELLAKKPEVQTKKSKKLSKDAKRLLCDIWIGTQEVAIAKFLKDNGISIKPKEIHTDNDYYTYKQTKPGKIEFNINLTPELLSKIDPKNAKDKTDESDNDELEESINEGPSSRSKTKSKTKTNKHSKRGKDGRFKPKTSTVAKKALKTAGKAALGVGKFAGKAALKGGKALGKAAIKGAAKGGKALGKAISKGIDATGLTSYKVSDKVKNELFNSLNVKNVLPAEYTKSSAAENAKNKNMLLSYLAKNILSSILTSGGTIKGGLINGKFLIKKVKGQPVIKGECTFV